MFSPLGLFKDLPCPQGQQCSLLHCIFSHKEVEAPLEIRNASQTVRHSTGSAPVVHATKKLKLSNSNDERLGENTSLNTVASVKEGQQHPVSKERDTSRKGSNESRQKPPQNVGELSSGSREISLPPIKQERKSTSTAPVLVHSGLLAKRGPQESLNPRMLSNAPASHAVRSSILAKLHAAIVGLNEKLAKNEEINDKRLILSPQELVVMALDEEETAAREKHSVYANVIKLRIVRLTKMNTKDWATEVEAYLNGRYCKTVLRNQPRKPAAFTPGLSLDEEIIICRKMITRLNGLEEFGYVTRLPTEGDIEIAKKGLAGSMGWEKCDRCGGRFQVFPGRREDGTLTSGGECTYHWAKPINPPVKKTDRIIGYKDAYYPCCNETVGTSAGCTKAKTHVFKVAEVKRLASILQFEETPEKPNEGLQRPVCFDCEMGYTTLGLELIRLTAVTWPNGKDLIDVLVRPIGEVLDLNSRYSGVFPEHYSTAVSYDVADKEILSRPSGNGAIEIRSLRVVESPAAARELLFEHLQPDTPLIGHAIDNDLNACRIIHPTVIDTALLFPHPQGLPNRMSLKALCRKYLDRDIQIAGDQGHDSMEDAIAAGDLVRFKAAELWKILKAKGWCIHDDKLVAPPGMNEKDEKAALVQALGSGAGNKRKRCSTVRP